MIVLWIASGFVLCALFMYVFNARGIMAARRKYRRAQARTQTKKQKREKIQVTKIIVFSIMITYYIAFAVAVWVVVAKDIYQLSRIR